MCTCMYMYRASIANTCMYMIQASICTYMYMNDTSIHVYMYVHVVGASIVIFQTVFLIKFKLVQDDARNEI